MFMRKYLIPVLIIVLSLAACRRPDTSGRDTIALVKSIAADYSAPEHILLASNGKPASSGDIYIVGDSSSCALISNSFLECDIYENARGRYWSDGLKDFAGERFASISDKLFTPYGSFGEQNGYDALRELSVRFTLSALSPKCNASIYDLDGNLEKVPAKMIILADPWFQSYGKFDIDTLFTLCACSVPVISPQDLLFDAALGMEKKYFNCGIICDSLYLASGIYQTVFNAKLTEHKVVGAHSFVAATPSGKVLAGFLESYLSAGGEEPLDALLIDDWRVNLNSVEEEVKAMRDFSREEYLRYGKLLAPDFNVFAASQLTMSRCYELLRERSLFTHRIAQPQSLGFTVKARPVEDGTEYLLIPVENVQD